MARLGCFLLVCLLVLPGLPLRAQERSERAQVKEMVQSLKKIVRRARERRSADPWLLLALEELIRRYDWPWSRRLLHETFADGDYTTHPAWQVASGQFWVDRGLGLRTRLWTQATQGTGEAQEEQDPARAIVGVLLEEIFKQRTTSAPQAPSPAPQAPSASFGELFLPLRITNAFALQTTLRIHNAPTDLGSLAYVVYQGQARDSGYRLTLHTGQEASLELESLRRGRAAVVEATELRNPLNGGEPHTLAWRRDTQGVMTVILDGKALFTVRDRRFRAPFDGISIVNRGGDYSIRSIALFGVE